MSWYVADLGLVPLLPDLPNPGQDDFLAPHDAFIPTLDKWFADAPHLLEVIAPTLPQGWEYPWEPSLYTVPVFDWFFQESPLQVVPEPVLVDHLDVPEWLVRTLPLGSPAWQQDSPPLIPPVILLPEIDMTLPLWTLDDATLPTTNTAVHGRAEESSGTYQRT